jgi:hypothetical protein
MRETYLDALDALAALELPPATFAAAARALAPLLLPQEPGRPAVRAPSGRPGARRGRPPKRGRHIRRSNGHSVHDLRPKM